MGDEYYIKFGARKTATLENIDAAICALGFYTRETCCGECLAFRWSHKPRRPDWPQDFTIYEEDTGLLVNVHAGSHDEIQKILQDMQSVLERLNVGTVSVEEV
jgi:hypothetical protein